MSLFRKMRKKGRDKDANLSDSDSAISNASASASDAKKPGFFDKIFKHGSSKGEEGVKVCNQTIERHLPDLRYLGSQRNLPDWGSLFCSFCTYR